MKTKDITINWIENGNRVKVLDGIAGAAKTSQTVKALQDAGIRYMHTTSTNKLKRGIESRFGHAAYTVASGLFDTDGTTFYQSEKDVSAPVVIIDEILQTDPRVFSWIANHEETRVIVCTDSKQMLAPVTGETNLRKLEELKTSADYETLGYSFRPVNDETRHIYNMLYNAPSDDFDMWNYIKTHAEEVPANDVEYDPNAAFVVHSNDIERDIYDRFELRNRYDLELIPKGTIASKEVTRPENYPIRPQIETDRAAMYLQISNIGSVVRFQGSEVLPGSSLYFCINPKACPSNRELYTAVTRAKDFKDFKIVYWKPRKDVRLVTFYGLPVLRKRPAVISGDYVVDLDKDGNAVQAKDRPLTQADIFKIQQEKQREDHTAIYSGVIMDGKPVKIAQQEKTPGMSMMGVLAKEPRLEMQFPNLLLRQIEKTGEMPIIQDAFSNIYINTNTIKHADGAPRAYALDLFSSYIHCWNRFGVPDGSTYVPNMSKPCRLYIVTRRSEYLKPGALITAPLFDYLDKAAPGFSAVCVGSTDYIKDDRVGAMLLEKCTKSAEDKAKTKTIHWGLIRREYIKPVYWNCMHRSGETPDAFVVDDFNKWNLLYIHITSVQMLTMCEIQTVIYKDIAEKKPGAQFLIMQTKVDCLNFDYSGDIIALGNKLTETVRGMRFRIVDNTGDETRTADKTILFQNFETLKTKKEIKRDKERERRHAKAALEEKADGFILHF